MCSSDLAARRIAADEDEADRRRQHLTLTPAGRRIYREIVPLALEREASLLEILSPQDRQALDRLLAKLQVQALHLAPAAGDEGEPD